MKTTRLTSRICCIGLSFALVSAKAVAAVNLAPHRAFYTLEAQRLDSSGGITAISGKLAYEITGNECDGYAVNYRIANRYIHGEGSPQTMDIQLNSFEAGDGSTLDMRQKQYVNANLESETRVRATKPANGGKITAEVEGKEPKLIEVDASAIFPTAFQKLLMEHAANGESRSSAIVFEGSDEDKASRAISFIGARRDGSKIETGADAETLAALNKLPAWPVTVSYFDINANEDAPPSYSASFNMLENGVSTDLVLDYGSYALKGKLEKIEMLKVDSCK